LPLYGISTEFTYSKTVYDKGADVVHTLNGYLGDSVFYYAVKQMLAENAFHSVSTASMCSYLTQVTGIDLQPFFDAWVYSPGWYHFSTDSFQVTPVAGQFETELWMRQRTKSTNGFATSNRIELTFFGENWEKSTGIFTFSGESGVQTFLLPFEPVSVIADLEEKISDATTDACIILHQPGYGSMNEVFFAWEILAITDSMMLRAEQSWIAPDPLIPEHTGLTLSDSRYWKIDGIFPDGLEAVFKFNYNNKEGADGWLDYTWWPYPLKADSLVLLYRPGSGSQWEIIEFERTGTSRNGYLTTQQTEKGEYTLAYRDRSNLSGNKDLQKNKFRILPNPAKGYTDVWFSDKTSGTLSLINLEGQSLIKEELNGDQHLVRIEFGQVTSGLYYISFDDHAGIRCSEKLIILRE
jgi:aminopeptidase N